MPKKITRRTAMACAAAIASAPALLGATPAAATADADAEMQALAVEYWQTLDERDRLGHQHDRAWSDKTRRSEIEAALWPVYRRAGELRRRILETPAAGVAGIAVKLSLFGFVDRATGNEQLDDSFAPVRAAFDDAVRVSGLDRTELLWNPTKHS